MQESAAIPLSTVCHQLSVSHLCLCFDKRYVMLIFFLVLYLVISYIMFVQFMGDYQC